MASGDIGQDDLLETLENIFKMMANKKRLAKERQKHKRNEKSQIKDTQQKDGVESSLNEKSNLTNSSGEKNSKKEENKKLLPEDRLTKEEVLKYLHAYIKNIDLRNFDLENYTLKNEMINDSNVSLHFVHATDKISPQRYSLSFDLESGQGKLTNTYLGEEKGSFVDVTDIKKEFTQDELLKQFKEINKTPADISAEKSAGVKVNLVESMTSYAKTLKMEDYQISSQSITDKQALIFLKHKTNIGDVMQISYDIEKENGKLTHLLSNKENNYANVKTVKNEFTKENLETHGLGKTPEQIQVERAKERGNSEDDSTEVETDYDEKVLDSRLGKSLTKQVLNDAELLKGAFALYQLMSMRKLLANSKDQVENLNSLLNKKDVNFDKIINVKDNLLEQIDVLQTKVSALEKNQDTTQTFDKLNDGFKKDQDEAYEKSNENKPTKVVETEHSM